MPTKINGVKHCYVTAPHRSWNMSHSLQQHGFREINKQLRFRMITSGLDTIKILVTRQSGKFKFAFSGSPEQVVKAEAILAAWG